MWDVTTDLLQWHLGCTGNRRFGKFAFASDLCLTPIKWSKNNIYIYIKWFSLGWNFHPQISGSCNLQPITIVFGTYPGNLGVVRCGPNLGRVPHTIPWDDAKISHFHVWSLGSVFFLCYSPEKLTAGTWECWFPSSEYPLPGDYFQVLL